MTKTSDKPKARVSLGVMLVNEPMEWTPSANSYTNEAGAIVQKFHKDICRVGDYYTAPGSQIEITGDMIDTFVAEFYEMAKAGVRVPLMIHAEQNPDLTPMDPRNLFGWVTRLWREGDDLMAEVEAIGADAIDAVRRNLVSIRYEPGYVDTAGNEYDSPITHVALTPVPVVNGQRDFKAVSFSQKEKSCIVLSRNIDSPPKTHDLSQEPAMTKELLEALGLTEAAKPEEAVAAVGSLKAKITECETKIAELAKSIPQSLSQDAAEMGTKLVKTNIARLVASGKMTPPQAALLTTALASQGVSLSRESHSLAEKILDSFEANQVLAPGGKTGAQVVDLAKADDSTPPRKDPDLDKRIAQVGGKSAA